MLVKKGQNNKISDLYIKIRVYTSRFIFIHQDSYLYIKIYMYTSGFAYMHQNPYIYIKIRTYTSRFCINTSRFIFVHQETKMAANRTNSLPNEEAISSSVRRVYRTMTEEVPCERSRVSGGNSSNAEEELFFSCREIFRFV